MKKQRGKHSEIVTMSRRLQGVLIVVVTLMTAVTPSAGALQTFFQHPDGISIQGIVRNSEGKPVDNAVVRLEQEGISGALESKTDAAGKFEFFAIRASTYVLTAEKLGFRSRATAVTVQSQHRIELVLEDTKAAPPNSSAVSLPSVEAMAFADKPNFTVAGVTDWTAVGGHGSDSSLRTSEALAHETLSLKAEDTGRSTAGVVGDAIKANEAESKLRADLARAPDSFETNRQLGAFYLHAGRYREALSLLQKAYRIDPGNYGNEYDLTLAYQGVGDFSQARKSVYELLVHKENADLHRLAGELSEKLGDPFAAVHEYERAVHVDPSEQNYFEWGSELLVHRAVWQAQEVFRKGAEIYPKSVRMLTGLGAALFAGAVYDDAALRLCAASDLNPTDSEPYLFMGKIQVVAPNPMVCVEQKLARFVHDQPRNALANYFYAMAILKRQQQSPDRQNLQQAEELLMRAVAIDAKCSDAYLQLGILAASQHSFEKAIDSYTKAIETNPQMREAHYRLGVAYDKIGERAKAKQEFQLHDEIKKQEAETIERQRREVKQFLVVLPEKQPTRSPSP